MPLGDGQIVSFPQNEHANVSIEERGERHFADIYDCD